MEMLEKVIRYYILIWAVMTPFMVLVFALLNRRVPLMRRINAWLDRAVGLELKSSDRPRYSPSLKQGCPFPNYRQTKRPFETYFQPEETVPGTGDYLQINGIFLYFLGLRMRPELRERHYKRNIRKFTKNNNFRF